MIKKRRKTTLTNYSGHRIWIKCKFFSQSLISMNVVAKAISLSMVVGKLRKCISKKLS